MDDDDIKDSKNYKIIIVIVIIVAVLLIAAIIIALVFINNRRPEVPTNVTATSMSITTFRVNWTPSANAEGYFIYVSNTPNFSITGGNITKNRVEGGSTNSSVVTVPATTPAIYYIRMTSFRGSEESAPSNEASVATSSPIPSSFAISATVNMARRFMNVNNSSVVLNATSPGTKLTYNGTQIVTSTMSPSILYANNNNQVAANPLISGLVMNSDWIIELSPVSSSTTTYTGSIRLFSNPTLYMNPGPNNTVIISNTVYNSWTFISL